MVQKLDTPSTLVIDETTIASLSAVGVLILFAYILSRVLLPEHTSGKLRIIYIWHVFDHLIHFIFEGSFLYNCFFTFKPGVSLNNFLSQPLRTYGPFYGSSPTAKLWQEYAKADRRWGESDLTIISLELLTVLGAGPLSTYICYCIQKQDQRMWYWMTILATAELYGGFITFAPEWLSGSQNLDTSNFMYLWVYLTFFNLLWVVFPIWILYEAYQGMTAGGTLSKSPKPISKAKKT